MRRQVMVHPGLLLLLVIVLAAMAGCQKKWPFLEDRYSKIPADITKGTPENDSFPPVLHSNEWEDPVPMPGPVNTAGGEDSPYITADGTEFYFFFTPDVRVPVELQVLDSVTGIWCSRLEAGAWTDPERVILSSDLSMDGCEVVLGDTIWFASVRGGNYGEIDWYTAVRREDEWADWLNMGEEINVERKPGEFHITSDHRTMYFGKPGQYGKNDLWKMERTAAGWDEPENLGPVVNGPMDETRPHVSSDMKELWFTGWSDSFAGPAVYLSRLDSLGQWGKPVPIVEQFAGEPTVDDAGNLYFIHHYYTTTGRMIEADVYVCRRKK